MRVLLGDLFSVLCVLRITGMVNCEAFIVRRYFFIATHYSGLPLVMLCLFVVFSNVIEHNSTHEVRFLFGE